MRFIEILLGFAVVAISAAPVEACIVHPAPVAKFWSSVPENIEAGEVVLEIQYLGTWKEPEIPGADIVVITDCPSPGISRYRVTRVLRGEFRGAEVFLPMGGGGIVGAHGNPTERHIVVGQFASYYSLGGHDAYPPKQPEGGQGSPSSVPLFYTRPPTTAVSNVGKNSHQATQ
ncbi:MAG: hypothetical protein EOO15_02685 [Chitinophagaceae bacterium]|nr:MAG: hypothetical protein EOO15_02685 [Chitinophagaceae bacterium]